MLRRDVAIRFEPLRGPPRRVRFAPWDGERWRRVDERWHGCAWVPAGQEIVTDLGIDAEPAAVTALVDGGGEDAGELVAVDRDALADVLRWVCNDPAMDCAEPGDPILDALDTLADPVRGPLCERCRLPTTATERCPDGTRLCEYHFEAAPTPE